MANENCNCVHEKEFGEITAERRRTDEHMQSTWKKIDRLTETMGQLKIVLERQAMQIGDLNSLRADILAVSKQISEVAIDSRASATRAHERIDQMSYALNQHTGEHCDDCQNTEKLKDIEIFNEKLEPLVPVANAVAKVRDYGLVVLLLVILVVALAAIFRVPQQQAMEVVKPSMGGIK